MRKIRHLIMLPALAGLAVVSVPAAATAHTVPAHTVIMPMAPDTCSGSVFSNVKFQNVKSGHYAAQSVVNDNLVLYDSTGQTFDGYRDPHGHLVIYKCGTSDVLTDKPDSECRKGYAACAYVAPYKDTSGQWWSRTVDGGIWYIESIHNSTDTVLTDPTGSSVSGTQLVLEPYSSGDTNQQFRVS
jgi:hypothetical protein